MENKTEEEGEEGQERAAFPHRTGLPPNGLSPYGFSLRPRLCASALVQKLQVSGEKEFFAQMVVDAVSVLDSATLDLKMIGIKKVQGGGLRDSFLVDGVAFKKTFSYAGFEQQPKSFTNAKILLLNIELELKSERENAEVREERRGRGRAVEM